MPPGRGSDLPHEWEWQYAAQGRDGRPIRGEIQWDPSGAGAGARAGTAPAHMWTPIPSGASPFGVMDLVGNVWQWTEEYVDLHTRAAILRGGSYYRRKARSGASRRRTG